MSSRCRPVSHAPQFRLGDKLCTRAVSGESVAEHYALVRMDLGTDAEDPPRFSFNFVTDLSIAD